MAWRLQWIPNVQINLNSLNLTKFIGTTVGSDYIVTTESNVSIKYDWQLFGVQMQTAATLQI